MQLVRMWCVLWLQVLRPMQFSMTFDFWVSVGMEDIAFHRNTCPHIPAAA